MAEPEDEYLTVDEIAQQLKYSDKAIYSWIKKGVLPATKFPRGVRVRRVDLDRYLEASRLPAASDAEAFMGEDAATVQALADPTT